MYPKVSPYIKLVLLKNNCEEARRRLLLPVRVLQGGVVYNQSAGIALTPSPKCASHTELGGVVESVD